MQTLDYLSLLTTEERKRVKNSYPSGSCDDRMTIGMALYEWVVDTESTAFSKLVKHLGSREAAINANSLLRQELLTPFEREFEAIKGDLGSFEMRSLMTKFVDPTDLAWHLFEEPWFSFDFELIPHFMQHLVIWRYDQEVDLHPKWLDCIRASILDGTRLLTPDDLEYIDYDDDAAQAEGWAVFHASGTEDEGILRIERVDEAEVFESDPDAWVHVLSRARAGSKLHLAALRRVMNNNQTEFSQLANVAFGMGIRDLKELLA